MRGHYEDSIVDGKAPDPMLTVTPYYYPGPRYPNRNYQVLLFKIIPTNSLDDILFIFV